MIWNVRNDEEWLTTAEMADRFRVTIWTVYKWRKRHALPTKRIDGLDHSPASQAALIDRDRCDETRGTPRLDAVAA